MLLFVYIVDVVSTVCAFIFYHNQVSDVLNGAEMNIETALVFAKLFINILCIISFLSCCCIFKHIKLSEERKKYRTFQSIGAIIFIFPLLSLISQSKDINSSNVFWLSFFTFLAMGVFIFGTIFVAIKKIK